ncbi:hypothetical protein A6A03_03670 [Chloroflexus islandicus]|uniref:Peptidase S74 domain-containing protein n=1 Tax=Chloroflexus islandicus TaxID=1707952 RepID=A0A178M435_9CHLR|nr:tail fiber domain-containing protein [Chloroflexus islandicus]OAN42826.1 hypothetical protein A6A03_03670 [Chloroflexus islandicus]
MCASDNDTTAFWALAGNSGTTAGTNFIGTTDNVALEIKVNSARTLRIEPNATSPNLIGGSRENTVTSGVSGATIGGSGRATNDCGTGSVPCANRVTDDYGTVGEGSATEQAMMPNQQVIARMPPPAGGIPTPPAAPTPPPAGGRGNTAQGAYSFVAGRRGQANAAGMFVWADSYNEPFVGSVANSFIVRASGGIYFGKATPSTGALSERFIYTWIGAHLTNGGVWTNASDRAAKENFANVNARAILSRVANLPIHTWNYIAEQATIRHIGPTVQDFYAAFGVGADDTHIATVDADGVALAAIQGLHQVAQE